MPPIVDSINKSHNNRHNPIYPSAIFDQVKKLGNEILGVCSCYKHLLYLNIEHLVIVTDLKSSLRPIVQQPIVIPKAIIPPISQRLEPPNPFPGAFPSLTPFQKQQLKKYLNCWKNRMNMQNNNEKLAEDKFILYLKRRAIYVWYGRLKEKQYHKRWNKKRKNLAELPDNFRPHSILKLSDKKSKSSRKVFRFCQNNDKIHSYDPENDDQIRYIEIIGGKNYVYNEEIRKEVKRVLGIGNFYEEKYLYKAKTTKVWKMAFEQYREGKHTDQQILKKLI